MADFPSQRIHVRVTPKARHNGVSEIDGLGREGRHFRVAVTTVPENGKATAEVVKLLAKDLGVAKSRFNLISGSKSRDKVFLLES